MYGTYIWVEDENGRLLIKVLQSKNRVCKIMLEEEETMCLLGETIQPTWLWHNHLDHVSFSALKHMSDANIMG